MSLYYPLDSCIFLSPLSDEQLASAQNIWKAEKTYRPYSFYSNKGNLFVVHMDQISLKTPNTKCRLYHPKQKSTRGGGLRQINTYRQATGQFLRKDDI